MKDVPDEPASPAVAVLSTSVAPPGKAYEFWQDSVPGLMGRIGIRAADPDSFTADLSAWQLDAVTMVRFQTSAQQVVKSQRMINRDAPEDCLSAIIPIAGQVSYGFADRQADIAVGTSLFADTRTPFDLRIPDHCDLLVARIPIDYARTLGRWDHTSWGQVLPGDGAIRVVRDFLVGLLQLAHTSPEAAITVAHNAPAMLISALTVATSDQAAEQARDLLTQRTVLDFIHRNATDPGLDPDMVASGCHISKRTLYRTLNDAGFEGLTPILRTHRIEHAKALMAVQPTLSLNAVAQRCGFTGDRQLRRALAAVNLTPASLRLSMA